MRTFVFIFSFLITQLVFSQADIREPGDRIDMVMELLHPNTQLELRFEMNAAKVIEKKMVLVTYLKNAKATQVQLLFEDKSVVKLKSWNFIHEEGTIKDTKQYALEIKITPELQSILLKQNLKAIQIDQLTIPITYNTKEDNLRAFMNELNAY
ncbi:MAG: hypothetical protein RLZZ500_2106 [Bacteroidota bacterium]|jgi:hypothetical protein